MERTSGLLCTAVCFVACLVVLGIIVSLLGQAILSNPGISQLIHVLGS